MLLTILRDIARLRLPVTAGAVLATVLAITAPFGLDLGGETTAQVTGALVAVGVVARYIELRFYPPLDLAEHEQAIAEALISSKAVTGERYDSAPAAEPAVSPAQPGT